MTIYYKTKIYTNFTTYFKNGHAEENFEYFVVSVDLYLLLPFTDHADALKRTLLKNDTRKYGIGYITKLEYVLCVEYHGNRGTQRSIYIFIACQVCR